MFKKTNKTRKQTTHSWEQKLTEINSQVITFVSVKWNQSGTCTLHRQSLSVPFGIKFLTIMTPSELHVLNDGGHI